ncbi:MAG: 30S ribosome-binding factor RbfA [Gammaproteobacteria bacterium]|nr:30S ribosome-binding factor RbfA [Gammaproteobacteria bacterium]MDH5803455.1 30S ribosome-binding factor RbfA [Gammaproteobacteria bacterium]
MAREYSRLNRVADEIQKTLALLLQNEVKDPRIGMVTITAVRVSKEFENAKVYFTAMGDKETVDNTAKGLTAAAGFLRSELAKRLRLRTTPRLVFVYDASIETGNRLSSLIDSAVSSDEDDTLD